MKSLDIMTAAEMWLNESIKACSFQLRPEYIFCRCFIIAHLAYYRDGARGTTWVYVSGSRTQWCNMIIWSMPQQNIINLNVFVMFRHEIDIRIHLIELF